MLRIMRFLRQVDKMAPRPHIEFMGQGLVVGTHGCQVVVCILCLPLSEPLTEAEQAVIEGSQIADQLVDKVEMLNAVV